MSKTNKGLTNQTRRNFLSTMRNVGALGAMGALGALSSNIAHSQKSQKRQLKTSNHHRKDRPNILFIVTDQERSWLDLPTEIDLPAHEYLLTQGTGFENYYVNTSPCSPSRSVIYTGRQTPDTGMTVNHGAPPFPELNQSLPTLGHYLRNEGYYTAYKGKWHLSHIESAPGLIYGNYPSRANELEPFGFSDYNLTGDFHGSVWTGRKMDSIIASEAKHWLETKATNINQPWCLSVNFVNPHDVMFYSTGPEQEASRLQETFLAPLRPEPAHELYTKDWSHVGLPKSFYAGLKDKPWAHTSFEKLLNDIFGHIPKDQEELWLANQSYYFNCIRDVSRQAYEVISSLEKIGQLENTIIVYTADHGEMAGAHGLRQKGPTIYKENSRVPLLIKHPDVQGGTTTKQLASAVDLVPTLLDMISSTQETELVGHSVLPALTKTTTKRDEQGLLFAYGVLLYADPNFMRGMIESETGPTLGNILKNSITNGSLGPDLSNRALHRGIFDGRYKFARYYATDSHHTPTDWDMLTTHNDLELYDTHSDPDEIHNLAAAPNKHKELILALNEKTNALVAKEIGKDDGREFTGPSMLYQL